MRLNLNSIIIFVDDLSTLERFYVDVLRLTVVEKIQDEWLLLSAGEVTLGLHGTKKNPDKESQENIKFHSNTKIIFEVEQDINALRDQLVSKGVKLKDVITWDNYDYWLCDGEDPEGNVFQLKQKK